SGRSKRKYTNKTNGFPYLSNTDVTCLNPFVGCKYISKKNYADSKSFLKNGMILTGRVGAIGQTAYVSELYEQKQAIGSDNIIRIVTKNNFYSGYLYAFFISKIGIAILKKLSAGGVQPYITEDMLLEIPIPIINKSKQKKIHEIISNVSLIRSNANKILEEAELLLMKVANLKPLLESDYDTFNVTNSNRKVSCFNISINKINTITFNAFNHSENVRRIKMSICRDLNYILLKDAIEGDFFSTGSFPRLELDSNKSITLINQSDIFNTRISGKKIARKKVNVSNLVQYGEVLIAAVGTLGDNETFCRVIFAGEELKDQLVSGEFIRMETNEKVPSGYLYTWLASEYGFRLIRSTQSGTKLCRPIQSLLYEIPVPILDKKVMNKIHQMVCEAHTMRYEALQMENQAISIIENEIASWQK
ncbi:MAG: restriction endonuclease subunit S, partial [Cytophagales bacterium]|nr:restriction endonuclease subunit S [Cytophagales bacterium]